MGCYLVFKASSVLPAMWEHNGLFPGWMIELLLNLSIGFFAVCDLQGLSTKVFAESGM